MAILKRRHPRSVLRKMKEYLWPSMGWLRTLSYYRHRVFRGGGSTYKIAAGFAMGAAISWTPLIGTHSFQSVFFAWMIRSNPIAGFAGTVVGNPVTFPFIFMTSYNVGYAICQFFGLNKIAGVNDALDFETLLEKPMEFLAYIFDHPLHLLLPLSVGGYLCAFIFWFLTYAAVYYPVKAMYKTYQAARIERKKARRQRYLADKQEKETQ